VDSSWELDHKCRVLGLPCDRPERHIVWPSVKPGCSSGKIIRGNMVFKGTEADLKSYEILC